MIFIAGAEHEKMCLSCDMVKEEGKRLRDKQRYLERMTHSIPYPQVKKDCMFQKAYMGIVKRIGNRYSISRS